MQPRADRWTDTAGIGGIAPDRLVFIDESAVLTSMTRRYGRSPRGQRATAKVPFGNWKRLRAYPGRAWRQEMMPQAR